MNLLPQQMRSQAKEYLSRYGLVLDMAQTGPQLPDH